LHQQHAEPVAQAGRLVDEGAQQRVPRSAASCVIVRGSLTAKRKCGGVMPAQRA
jgi:hypothetical protein